MFLSAFTFLLTHLWLFMFDIKNAIYSDRPVGLSVIVPPEIHVLLAVCHFFERILSLFFNSF